jgi:hypothetical protein
VEWSRLGEGCSTKFRVSTGFRALRFWGHVLNQADDPVDECRAINANNGYRESAALHHVFGGCVRSVPLLQCDQDLDYAISFRE